jgi:hypothetical protein
MGPNQYNQPPNGPYGPYGPPQQQPLAPPPPYGQQPVGPYGAPVGPQPQMPSPGYPIYDPYADLRAPQPSYMAPPPPPRRNNGKKALVVIVVIALLAIGGGLLAMSGSGQPTQTKKPVQQNTQKTEENMPDVVARSDGDLDLGKKINVSKHIKAQSIQAKTNEQVNLSDGFSFLVKSAGPYQSTTVQPAAGKKFIIVLTVVGNRAEGRNASVSYLDFKLLDSKGALLNAHPATQQITNNPLATPAQLEPGYQIEGRLVYEVDAVDTIWNVIHRKTYQKTTDNTSFVVEGKVAIDAKSDGTAGATPAQAAEPAAGQ